jgi:hypothetical protein
MHFRQHVPGYCEGVEAYEFDFTSAEELTSHPRVAAWKADDYTGKGSFHRFSLGPYDSFSHLLMAEYDGGKHWWVVGYVADAAGLDLPAWTPVVE